MGHRLNVAVRALSFQNKNNALSNVRSGGPKSNISQIAGPSSTSKNSTLPVISKQLTTVLSTGLDVLKDATPENETFTYESIYGEKSSDLFVEQNNLSISEQFSIGLSPKIGSELSVNAEKMPVSSSTTSQNLSGLKATILENIDKNQSISSEEKETFKTKIQNEMNTLIKQSLQERCSVKKTMMSLVDADIDQTIKMNFKEKALGTFFKVSDEKAKSAQDQLTKFSQSDTVSHFDFLKQNDAVNNIKKAKGTVKRKIGSMPFTFQETVLKLGKAIKRTFAKLLTKEFHNIKKNMNDIRKSVKTYSKYKFFSEDNRQILDNHNSSLSIKMDETSKVVDILKDVVKLESDSEVDFDSKGKTLQDIKRKIDKHVNTLEIQVSKLNRNDKDYRSQMRNKTRTFNILTKASNIIDDATYDIEQKDDKGLSNTLHYLNDKLQNFATERYDEIHQSEIKALELDKLVTLLDKGKSAKALASTAVDITTAALDITSSGLKIAAVAASAAAPSDGGTTSVGAQASAMTLHALGHGLKGTVSLVNLAHNIIKLQANAKIGDKEYVKIAEQLSSSDLNGDRVSDLLNQMEITRTGVIESSKKQVTNMISLIYGISASAYSF